MANDAFDATARVLLSEFAGKMANDAVDATVRVLLSEFDGKQWQTMPLMLHSCAAVRIRWQTMANDAVDATVREWLSEFAGKRWQTMPLMLQLVCCCPNSLANNGKRCR
ncbi:unnamed protein product [Cylicocyclus nassatus]|uniref:Uncharacterized protein n=1 Tax=Cylicocyclus nassatus TaxID=53992 RepID=A0AA36MG36_CYLNA|nr:unnamed protein product [Cylicocyclus nassatus]CAJ0608508.1 unnamed protein product [Cylicocyclus nassatus]CAJ0608509.1 unnamed protein product [Cylicocyclus nassatus]